MKLVFGGYSGRGSKVGHGSQVSRSDQVVGVLVVRLAWYLINETTVLKTTTRFLSKICPTFAAGKKVLLSIFVR